MYLNDLLPVLCSFFYIFLSPCRDPLPDNVVRRERLPVHHHNIARQQQRQQTATSPLNTPPYYDSISKLKTEHLQNEATHEKNKERLFVFFHVFYSMNHPPPPPPRSSTTPRKKPQCQSNSILVRRKKLHFAIITGTPYVLLHSVHVVGPIFTGCSHKTSKLVQKSFLPLPPPLFLTNFQRHMVILYLIIIDTIYVSPTTWRIQQYFSMHTTVVRATKLFSKINYPKKSARNGASFFFLISNQ